MLKLKYLRSFFFVYLLFIVVGAVLLLLFQKGDIVIGVNQNSTELWDNFFMIVTYLGLGGVFVIPIAIALLMRYEYAITGAASLIIIGIFSYLFKQVIFKGMHRPTKFFTDGELTHFIEGFNYHGSNTFPSGHTMTAFGMMLFVALIFKNKWISLFSIILALLIGFSRIYLLQHFFVDVYVGSALGIISVFLGYIIGNQWLGNKYPVLKTGILCKKQKK